MAEHVAAASSPASVGMTMHFATAADATLEEAPRYLSGLPSALGASIGERGQGEAVAGGDAVAPPPEGESERETKRERERERGRKSRGGESGGGGGGRGGNGEGGSEGPPAASILHMPASSGRTPIPEPLPTAAAVQPIGMIPAESVLRHECWWNRRMIMGVAGGRGRYEGNFRYMNEQTPKNSRSFHSAMLASPVAAAAHAGGNSDGFSDLLSPKGAAVRGISGITRGLGKIQTENSSVQNGTRQHFGVKRSRSLEGNDNDDDEQGGEEKRISSPHRLIRRSSIGVSTASIRSVKSLGLNFTQIDPTERAGTNVSVAIGRMFNHTNAPYTSQRGPRDVTPRHVADFFYAEQRKDQRENRTSDEARPGGALTREQFREGSPNGSAFLTDATNVAESPLGTGLGCRSRHRSLKVQRVYGSPVDTLTSGVQSLDVMSPAVSPADVGNGNTGRGSSAATNASIWTVQVSEAEPVESMAFALSQRSSRRLDMDTGIASRRARSGGLPTVAEGAVHVDVSPRSNDTILPPAPAPVIRDTPSQQQQQHFRRSFRLGSCVSEEVVEMDIGDGMNMVQVVSDCSSSVSLGMPAVTPGPGVPRFDTASTSSSSADRGDDRMTRGSGGRDGGVSDDDCSSDAGAAHAEISAWLHSTDDWWTS